MRQPKPNKRLLVVYACLLGMVVAVTVYHLHQQDFSDGYYGALRPSSSSSSFSFRAPKIWSLLVLEDEENDDYKNGDLLSNTAVVDSPSGVVYVDMRNASVGNFNDRREGNEPEGGTGGENESVGGYELISSSEGANGSETERRSSNDNGNGGEDDVEGHVTGGDSRENELSSDIHNNRVSGDNRTERHSNLRRGEGDDIKSGDWNENNNEEYEDDDNDNGDEAWPTLLPDNTPLPPEFIRHMPPEFNTMEEGLDWHHPPLKKILVWSEGYGSKTMSFGYGRAPFVRAGCEVDTCLLTGDRDLMPLKEFDALIFHFRALDHTDMPKYRYYDQTWVFWEVESASYVYQDPALYNGLFNLTMTYRTDSDVVARYGRVYRLPSSASPSASSTAATSFYPVSPSGNLSSSAYSSSTSTSVYSSLSTATSPDPVSSSASLSSSSSSSSASSPSSSSSYPSFTSSSQNNLHTTTTTTTTTTTKTKTNVQKEGTRKKKKKKTRRKKNKGRRNYAEGKTRMAAWFVSNCYTHSRREKLVEAMQKFIKVDIYGGCGTMKCSRANTHLCYTHMARKYKFYLSFENSLCKDYVTEKLFSVLRYDVVPVVFGLANYSSLAPPHSYVNALDFPSVEHLVNHLKYLDQNHTAYNEYFRWKDYYYVDDGWSNTARGFCDLCRLLHRRRQGEEGPQGHTYYKDLSRWFLKEGQCRRLDTRLWSAWLW